MKLKHTFLHTKINENNFAEVSLSNNNFSCRKINHSTTTITTTTTTTGHALTADVSEVVMSTCKQSLHLELREEWSQLWNACLSVLCVCGLACAASVDGCFFELGGSRYRSPQVLFFVLCGVCGFEFSYRSFRLGMSQRRAKGFKKWTRELATAEHVQMPNFVEGLFRIMNVAGDLGLRTPILE